MKKKYWLILLICPFFWFFGANFIKAAMNSANYQIWADAISLGGAEDSASANYQLDDTLGEAVVGRGDSTNYSGRAGFREMNKNAVLTLTLSESSLNLGELSKTANKSASHRLTVGTNSSSGVSVSFSGNTLTCSACIGINTVIAIGATAASSAVGTSQFGFNISYYSGTAPIAAASAPYNGSGYAFHSGDAIISSIGAINATIFDISYIANISGSEAVGSYSAAITYTATANF